ncbi:MAG: Mut7-C RNAse domain-containing protein [Halobacteriales archaeon]
MTRLLLDAMLGRLATYLRMCGYDAAYALDRGVEDDDRLLAWAREEDRRLVTRDVTLARRSDDALLVESKDIDDQLRRLREARFDLTLDEPERCAACNGPLERVPDGDPTPEYAPNSADRPVWRCRDCGQHFWRGSHWDDVRERLADL